MTGLEVIALVAWVIFGLGFGFIFAIEEKRRNPSPYDDNSLGLIVLACIMLSPLIAIGFILFGMVWSFDRLVDKADEKIPLTRAQQARRIEELESELELS